MKDFEAVFFDFDGVTANTAEDNFAAWNYAFAPLGISIDRRTCFTLEGMRVSDLAATVLKQHGLDPARGEEVARRKDQRYAEQNNFKFYELMPDFLLKLRAAGKKTGLVSGGSKHRLFKHADTLVFPRFDTIVTAEDVRQGKPAADPYLMAAERVGIVASKCVVIENAPLGVQSAKAAGMLCIALTTTLLAQDLAGADLIVADLAAAARFLGVE